MEKCVNNTESKKGCIIDVWALVAWIKDYADTLIGKDVTGKATTLTEELAMIAKYIMKGDVYRLTEPNYYDAKQAYYLVEMSLKEKGERWQYYYLKAFRKILWLNTVCRQAGYGMILTRKVRLDSMADVIEVVETFEETIRRSAAEVGYEQLAI